MAQGKKTIKKDSKEKKVLSKPIQDIDTSLAMDYNERVEVMDMGEDSIEGEEKSREGEGREKKKSKRTITIKKLYKKRGGVHDFWEAKKENPK